MLPPKEYKLLFSGEIPAAAPLSIKFMMLLLFNAMFGILGRPSPLVPLEFFVKMPFERLSICFFCSSSRSLSSKVAFMDGESKVCASKLFSILDMGKDINDVIVFIVNFLAFKLCDGHRSMPCKRRTLLKVVRPTPTSLAASRSGMWNLCSIIARVMPNEGLFANRFLLGCKIGFS